MSELWLQVALPVVTGVVGWATNAYRNAQKKERRKNERKKDYDRFACKWKSGIA